MRYHKATPICKVEADFIAETSLSSRNENVVICHGEQWYDVRALTEKELEEFVADLLRAQLDELRSGLILHIRTGPASGQKIWGYLEQHIEKN